MKNNGRMRKSLPDIWPDYWPQTVYLLLDGHLLGERGHQGLRSQRQFVERASRSWVSERRFVESASRFFRLRDSLLRGHQGLGSQRQFVERHQGLRSQRQFVERASRSWVSETVC